MTHARTRKASVRKSYAARRRVTSARGHGVRRRRTLHARLRDANSGGASPEYISAITPPPQGRSCETDLFIERHVAKFFVVLANQFCRGQEQRILSACVPLLRSE